MRKILKLGVDVSKFSHNRIRRINVVLKAWKTWKENNAHHTRQDEFLDCISNILEDKD